MRNWLAGDDLMGTRAARIFREENEKLLREPDEFESMVKGDLFAVVAECC